MKKQINEPDCIGGQGPLTKEEEVALSKYFAKKTRRPNLLSQHPLRQKHVRKQAPDNARTA